MHNGHIPVVTRATPEEREEETIRAIFLVGQVVNYLLWGVLITQSYNYYKSYRKVDNVWLKGAVGLLFVAETIQSVSSLASGWSVLVQDSGALPGPQQFIGWGGNLVPFTNAFTASIVHFFYAHKIWTLLNAPYSHICTAVVLAFSCLQLTAGLGCTAFQFSINMTLTGLDRIKTWVCIWFIAAVVTDIIITLLMTWKLSSSQTGIKDTDNMISKLIRLIVETGLATAIVQIVGIAIYLRWPHKLYFIVAVLIGPKVYSNSMLALLNSRRPRKAGVVWESRQDRPLDSIQIRTTRTVDVATDYELDEQAASDNGKANSLPFVGKEGA